MAVEKLPTGYLKAGEDYYTALKTLGLFPQFLGWGQEEASRQWLLVMVTSIVEIGGPLALNGLLFKAYNMKATPQEISPFIVRVFGDRTLAAPIITKIKKSPPGTSIATAQFISNTTGEPEGEPFPLKDFSFGQTIAGIHFESRDCYILDKNSNKQGHEQKTREWLKFKHNVEKLAA